MIEQNQKPDPENDDPDKKLEEKQTELPKFSSAVDPWDRELPPKINRHNYQDYRYEDWDDERR